MQRMQQFYGGSVSYIISLVRLRLLVPLKSSIRFYHSRDDFIQFTPNHHLFFFLFSLPKPSSMNHRMLLPPIFTFSLTVCVFFFLFYFAFLCIVNTFRIFCMNVFHFSNIVIELDVLFFGPHHRRHKEVLMSVKRKTHNKKFGESPFPIHAEVFAFRWVSNSLFVRQFNFQRVEYYFMCIDGYVKRLKRRKGKDTASKRRKNTNE